MISEPTSTASKPKKEDIMLGEKIGGISGRITGQRVLPNLGGSPKMESSFQASGSILGVDIKDTGTYCTLVRPDGTQYGEGQGVMVTKDGEMATMDRPWRRRDEQRWDRELSGSYLFADHPHTVVPTEQGRCGF